MKNFIILISFLNILFSCSDKKNIDKNYENYIYNFLKIRPSEKGLDYFIILNPKSSCTSCYLSSIKSAISLKNKYNIKFITNYDISRFIKDSGLTKFIDDECKFSTLSPTETLNTKLLIFKNRELLFDKTLSMANIDSIEKYILNFQ